MAGARSMHLLNTMDEDSQDTDALPGSSQCRSPRRLSGWARALLALSVLGVLATALTWRTHSGLPIQAVQEAEGLSQLGVGYVLMPNIECWLAERLGQPLRDVGHRACQSSCDYHDQCMGFQVYRGKDCTLLSKCKRFVHSKIDVFVMVKDQHFHHMDAPMMNLPYAVRDPTVVVSERPLEGGAAVRVHELAWSPMREKLLRQDGGRPTGKFHLRETAPPYEGSAYFQQDASSSASAGSSTSSSSITVSFHVYLAENDGSVETENVNAADLPGILWYLHTNVVTACPRTKNITRVARLKLTARLHNGHSLGPFVQFENGKCTTLACDMEVRSSGFQVGCQNIIGTAVGCYGHELGHWFSLPGSCPGLSNADKTGDCRRAWPGGKCTTRAELLRPGGRCTYLIERDGEVSLDKLAGWNGQNSCQQGHREYDQATDRGVGTSFWDSRRDPEKADWRIAQVRKHFAETYPLSQAFGQQKPHCAYNPSPQHDGQCA